MRAVCDEHAGARGPDDTLRAPRFAAPASQITLLYRARFVHVSNSISRVSASSRRTHRHRAQPWKAWRPRDIDPEAPLFKTGLALDSIDAPRARAGNLQALRLPAALG